MERTNSGLSVRRQCLLLGISRNGLYYISKGPSESDLLVMRMLDEQYTRAPFYGVERMTAALHACDIVIGHNRVRRLLRLTGLEALYPKPFLSAPSTEHRIYPYLLTGVSIERPNQVWAADITYIRLCRGFVYLMAIMDWYSRYVVSWSLSTSLDATFCLEALERALDAARPQIFNSDQGSQFTSRAFTGMLEEAGASISMDGKGRVFDNIFVERLWRTVKYEEVYIKDYQIVADAIEGIGSYFRFYNDERLHQSLNYKTPAEVYYGRCSRRITEPELDRGAAPLGDAAGTGLRLNNTAAFHLN